MADRWEDLPPVDEIGWLADQGRNWLQQTDARISRLGLPDFMRQANQRIQGLQEGVSGLYSGLQGRLDQSVRDTADAAERAKSVFNDYATERITTLGLGFSDLGAGLNPPPGVTPPPSEAQRLGSALSAGAGSIFDQVGNDWQQQTSRMGGQLAGRYPRLAALGRNGSQRPTDMTDLGTSLQAARSGVERLGSALE